MALKTFRPTSPGRRQLVIVDRAELHKGKPVKALTEGLTKSGGRNNLGRVTAFRTGGAEAYEFGSSYYWSSSDYNASVAWCQYWYSSSPGYQGYDGKAGAYRVRAVRRSVI